MYVTYDEKADAVYIDLNPSLRDKKGVVDHTKEAGENVCVDYTKEGQIVGIGILSASKILNVKDLESVTFEHIVKK